MYCVSQSQHEKQGSNDYGFSLKLQQEMNLTKHPKGLIQNQKKDECSLHHMESILIVYQSPQGCIYYPETLADRISFAVFRAHYWFLLFVLV